VEERSCLTLFAALI